MPPTASGLFHFFLSIGLGVAAILTDCTLFATINYLEAPQRKVMDRSNGKVSACLAKLAWPIWILYTVAWSWALLTPQPIRVRDALLSEKPAITSSKVVHVAGYLAFTILSGWLRLAVPYRLLILAFLSLHAFGTEYLQQFVPLRTSSLHDAGFDHLGIVLGLAVTWKWWLVRSTGPASVAEDIRITGR